MKITIACSSVSHGNTRQVADAIAEVLSADVIDPKHADPTALSSSDLIGFGSGIYNQKFHRDLLALIESLPPGQGGKAFVFATSGFPDSGPFRFSHRLVRLLEQQGFEVLDTFSCRGHDTYGPFKLVGGLHKGQPAAADLAAARRFAEALRDRAAAPPTLPN